jgi:hypothetical protein
MEEEDSNNNKPVSTPEISFPNSDPGIPSGQSYNSLKNVYEDNSNQFDSKFKKNNIQWIFYCF